MSRVIKCSLCGKKITTDKPRIKYCDECRAEARTITRDKWRKRTNYNEKQRKNIQEKRARELEEFLGRTRAQKEAERRAKELEDQERKKQNRKELLAAAKRGDAFANMQLSKGFEDPNYWKWYKKEEQADIKRSEGVLRDSIVNGISIYDQDFEQKVIESIAEEGRIFSQLIYNHN